MSGDDLRCLRHGNIPFTSSQYAEIATQGCATLRRLAAFRLRLGVLGSWLRISALHWQLVLQLLEDMPSMDLQASSSRFLKCLKPFRVHVHAKLEEFWVLIRASAQGPEHFTRPYCHEPFPEADVITYNSSMSACEKAARWWLASVSLGSDAL